MNKKQFTITLVSATRRPIDSRTTLQKLACKWLKIPYRYDNNFNIQCKIQSHGDDVRVGHTVATPHTHLFRVVDKEGDVFTLHNVNKLPHCEINLLGEWTIIGSPHSERNH